MPPLPARGGSCSRLRRAVEGWAIASPSPLRGGGGVGGRTGSLGPPPLGRRADTPHPTLSPQGGEGSGYRFSLELGLTILGGFKMKPFAVLAVAMTLLPLAAQAA